MNLKDIQSQKDHRKIEINKVGVKSIRYPIIVLDKKNKTQHTVATIDMYVNLPHHFKGTHMSRFIESLNTYRQGISIENLSQILIKMKEKLHSESAHMGKVVRRLRDALEDIDDVLDEPLDLRVRAIRQRSVWNHALDRVRVRGAHEPDAVSGDELNVVVASPSSPGS